MSYLGKFLASFTYDLLFFSNDVQTTAIAVAVTGSLCCSIVYAIVHLVTRLHCTTSSTHASTHIFTENNLTVTGIFQNQLKLKKVSKSPCSTSEQIQECKRCGKHISKGLCHNVCGRIVPYTFHKSLSVINSTGSFTLGPKYIDLSETCMKDVPDRLGFLGAQLTFLNLSNNSLQTLPENIGLLIGLQHLHIQNNLLSTIPVSLGTLPALCYLDLSNNNIKNIPESLWNLAGLKYLYLDSNNLHRLSVNFGVLSSLTVLSFGFNYIKNIPTSIGTLLNLQVLSSPNNPITVLPDSACLLLNLEELNLSRCCLTSLPKDIGSCKNLQKLTVDNNRLKEIPYSIGQLRYLVKLDISNNNISILPSALENMPRISLYAKGNPLLSTKGQQLEFLSQWNNSHCTAIPPLQDISARSVYEYKQKYTTSLPRLLQEMLKNGIKCCGCWRPVFNNRIYDIQEKSVGDFHNIYPLLYIYCSKHCQQQFQSNQRLR